MSRNNRMIITFGVLALLAVFVLIIYARVDFYDALNDTASQYELPVTTQGPLGETAADPLVTKGVLVPPVSVDDPQIGATQPKLTIIEFGDFQCPYCADITGVLAQALETYPDVRLAWKDLPNPLHPEARPAALAARCAQSQNQFWEYHDLLFSNQGNLSGDIYLQLAEQLGLDSTSFQSCLDSQAFVDIIGRGIEQANIYEVTGTPYLFVGSQRVDQAVSFEQLSQLIDQELVK